MTQMKSFVVKDPSANALRALNYSPEVERIRQVGSSSSRVLRTILKEIGPAHGAVFTRIDCHADYGVELISQGDIFSTEPHGRVIRLDSMPHPDRHLVT